MDYRIYKYNDGIVVSTSENNYRVAHAWDDLVNREGLHRFLKENLSSFEVLPIDFLKGDRVPLAPIGRQEVWASGVTYKRSKEARMEESEKGRGDYFYDKVYDADRPELFFKSTAARVVGPHGQVHIRRDSTWDVPEPELTLFICSEGSIEGFTIGNDMSSRSIEGENPLYLPQAKTYDNSAALGPCILVPENPLSVETGIHLAIYRDGNEVFADRTQLSSMKRELAELARYLFLETSFPHGCFLMTGTGIVPPSDLTLKPNDRITITIDGIGELINDVAYRQ